MKEHWITYLLNVQAPLLRYIFKDDQMWLQILAMHLKEQSSNNFLKILLNICSFVSK